MSGAELQLEQGEIVDGRVKSGRLVAPGGAAYPIVDFIPRFVSSDNYAANFGLEWIIHSRTQYDKSAGNNLSEDRVFKITKWPRDMRDEVILEAGSGSGRFTEHLLGTGATVVSFDYSVAVAANYQSNGANENLLLVQADMYQMPFEPDAFDRVLCFGVLQHTPNPKRALTCLASKIKPGGVLATDIYLKNLWRYYLNTRYWVRPLTRNMKPERLYRLCKGYIDIMWPLARIFRLIPVVGDAINWRLLIADYKPVIPDADDATLKEWAYLDTFDMLSPAFDQPQTVETFRRWHEELNLADIDVYRGERGFVNAVVGTARKP